MYPLRVPTSCRKMRFVKAVPDFVRHAGDRRTMVFGWCVTWRPTAMVVDGRNHTTR